MEGGLTFTIGKGFGQMLQRIAWERLTEKLSPRAAVEIITQSLPGCTEGMAVDILDGKITLGEDEATLEVTGTPGAGGKFNDWIRAQRVLLEEEAKEWVEVLERLRQTIADAGAVRVHGAIPGTCQLHFRMRGRGTSRQSAFRHGRTDQGSGGRS